MTYRSHRIRHVIRMYNDFKFQLNLSITNFKAPDKITAWNQGFDYDAYLEDQTKKEY